MMWLDKKNLNVRGCVQEPCRQLYAQRHRSDTVTRRGIHMPNVATIWWFSSSLLDLSYFR